MGFSPKQVTTRLQIQSGLYLEPLLEPWVGIYKVRLAD
jgi:hypothetical protein